MPDPTTPDVKAAVSQLKMPLLEALMDKTPASLRRLGAAAAGVALPFASSFTQTRFGFGLDDSMLISTQAFLTAYIVQSVTNEIHERGTEAKASVVTATDAVKALNDAGKL